MPTRLILFFVTFVPLQSIFALPACNMTNFASWFNQKNFQKKYSLTCQLSKDKNQFACKKIKHRARWVNQYGNTCNQIITTAFKYPTLQDPKGIYYDADCTGLSTYITTSYINKNDLKQCQMQSVENNNHLVFYGLKRQLAHLKEILGA